MFSLCIPTMDRFDTFLSKYLPKYLKNELISEIIIGDENGADVDKINKHFPDNAKLKLFKNQVWAVMNCTLPGLRRYFVRRDF